MYTEVCVCVYNIQYINYLNYKLVKSYNTASERLSIVDIDCKLAVPLQLIAEIYNSYMYCLGIQLMYP